MSAEETRDALYRRRHREPFQPFVISLANGDRFPIEHPENVAFDPSKNGGRRLSVVTSIHFCCSTLESVSSIIDQEAGRNVGA